MNRRTAFGLFALAVVLRLLVFWAVGPTPHGGTAFYYEAVARNLMEGEGFSYYPYWLMDRPLSVSQKFEDVTISVRDINMDLTSDTRLAVRAPLYRYPPAYPVFLAACHLLFGLTAFPVILVQLLLNGLVAVMIGWMAWVYFQDRRAALAAGILAAAWPFTLMNSLSYEPTSLLYVTVIGSVAALTAYMQTRRLGWIALSGILCGLSAMLRTDALFACFGLAATLLLMKPAEWRGRLIATCILLITTGAVMSPWLIRNAFVYHRFVPLSCGLGVNLVIGIGKYIPESGFPAYDRKMIEEEYGADYVAGAMYTDDGCYPDGIGREEKRTQRALAYIREHPASFLMSCIRRAPDLFFVGLETAKRRLGSDTAAWKKIAAVTLAWIEPVIFVLALAGLWLARAAFDRSAPAVWSILFYALGHLPMWVEPRYFKPAWPLLLLFAAALLIRKK